jgi:hypothetical protein
MLRITIHDEPEARTFRFEGTLAGPWVQEAEACWRGTPVEKRLPCACFDLTGLTMVDSAGKSFLSAAHAQGAVLVASGCLMRAIVAQITNSPAPDCGCP